MGEKNNKKKNTLDVNASFTQVSEQAINNGEILSANAEYKTTYGNLDIYEPNKKSNKLIYKTYVSNNYIPNVPLTINNLRDYYKQHNKSIDDTYNYLVSFIKDNKDNPEVVQQTISSILGSLQVHYDKKENSGGAGSTKEVLEKCINTNNNVMIEGLICGPIAELAVDVLKDSGIQAAIVPQVYNTRHAILVYKQGENQYVFNNYDKNIVLRANNIKDAISEYSKKEGIAHSPGAKRLLDGDSTYSEYAYKDSAYRGEELSKHTYNSESAFAHNPIHSGTGIDASVVTTNLGSLSADVTGNIVKNNSQYSASLGFVKKGESTMFLNSTSVGGKFAYNKVTNKNNSTTFLGIENITTVISGEHGGSTYTNSNLNKIARDNILMEFDKEIENLDISMYSKEDQEKIRQQILKERQSMSQVIEGDYFHQEPTINKSTNLATFIKGEYGKNITFKESKDTQYNFGYKLSGNILYSTDNSKFGNNSGDYRIIAEGGLGIANKGDKYQLQAGASGGVFVEYNEPIAGGFNIFSAGTKLNVDGQLEYRPSNNSVIGVSASIYDAIAPSSNNYGGIGNIYAAAKFNNITFRANGGVEVQQEKIKLGFNEKTEDNLTLNVQLSGKKGKTTVYGGVQHHIDNLNKTRNYTGAVIGVKQVF